MNFFISIIIIIINAKIMIIIIGFKSNHFTIIIKADKIISIIIKIIISFVIGIIIIIFNFIINNLILIIWWLYQIPVIIK